jgi:hypothetical protein
MNSDGDKTSSLQFAFGPSFTLLLGGVYLGIDVPVRWYSFDGVNASTSGGHPVAGYDQEIRADSLLMLTPSLRFGVPIRLSRSIDLVLEARGQSAVVVLTQDKVEAKFYEQTPKSGVRYEAHFYNPSSVIGFGGAFSIALRFRLGRS